jgi:thiamine phosphate synthase YjbQ (UPF0047 family)
MKRSGLQDGIMTAFISGSTAAVRRSEYEPVSREDFPKMLERVTPKGIKYEHHNTWHESTGHSHVRSA